MKKIPLILHQIWYQGLDNIKEPYKKCYTTVVKGVENTGWQHIFWDQAKIEAFIRKHYPQYWDLYEYFPNLIQKLDISRYIILYHYGGCYLDMDVAWIKDFSVLIEPDDELIFSNTMQRFVNNGTLLSSPKNRFWLDFLGSIARKKKKKCFLDRFLYVQLTTGPLSFNLFMRRKKNEYNIKILDYKYLEPCKSKYDTDITKEAFLMNYYGNFWISPIYSFFIYLYSRFKVICLLSLIITAVVISVRRYFP